MELYESSCRLTTLIRVPSAHFFSRGTAELQPKKKENAEICGRVAVRGQLLRNFESAGECGSPAKNKNRSRHVFIFVSALAPVM
jgi:hypothetical protein